ncbi:MAG: CPBP family intramembrane glutamic endopeptidase [Candidatus Bathyarchaeia archaeon]
MSVGHRRDLLLFLAFSLALIFTIYGLRNVSDPETYLQLDFYHKLMMGWIVLLGYMAYYGKPGSGGIDFDENLSLQTLLSSLFALIALLLLSILAAPALALSPSQPRSGFAPLFSIPRLQMAIPALGGILDEFCKQLFIVAHGEEVMRLAPALIFAQILRDTHLRAIRLRPIGIDLGTADVIVAGAIPSAFWAWFHAIKAYSSLALLPMIFIAGMILFLLTLKTRCLLSAILVHALYNTIALA